MQLLLTTLVAAAMFATDLASAAISREATLTDDAANIAGHSLRLNGSGIGHRLMFKVYEIGLYLPEPRHNADAVIENDGPTRIAIVLLRDVSSEEFARAIAESSQGDAVNASEPGASGLANVCQAITSLPEGLRKGDRLTLDWIPEVGTLVELNRKPLMRPNADRSVYKALLKVWLGSKPADAGLKARLLGVASS